MPYSSATSIMTSRDHPFNQSSRPLLAERKTQFLVKKSNKFNSNNNNNNSKSSSRQLQSTDRESLKVHGINDFDLISQQYRTYNNHNMGYPYGSPPSPRSPVFETQKSDFVFNDSIQNHSNNYYNSNVHNWQQFQQQHHNHHQQQLQHTNHNGGPFIFGVHDNLHNNQLHNPHHHQPQDIYDSVINNSKYSLKSGLQTSLSKSDTSSSSRSSGNSKESNFLVKTKRFTKSKDKKKSKKKQKENGKSSSKLPNIKCVVVGDACVGKTNLIVSYLDNRFIAEHNPTASDIYNAEVMVNDSPVNLNLCDTAGQDTLDPLRELCYPDSDVFVLCFSTVKPETFQSIKTKWAPKFSKTKASLILVGTQADLKNDIHVLNKLQMNGEKPVSGSDAWDFAASIGAQYIETSSYTQVSCSEQNF
ncbi:hypothetical protein ACFFRR_002987 [Megaselia abdita]